MRLSNHIADLSLTSRPRMPRSGWLWKREARQALVSVGAWAKWGRCQQRQVGAVGYCVRCISWIAVADDVGYSPSDLRFFVADANEAPPCNSPSFSSTRLNPAAVIR